MIPENYQLVWEDNFEYEGSPGGDDWNWSVGEQ